MPRRIFPAGTATNTTGAPLRLTFHADNTTGRRETDLWTVDGSNNLSAPIANGIVLTDATGAYSAFAGPDDLDTLYRVSHTGSSRTSITATGYVASSSQTSSFLVPSNNLSDVSSVATARVNLGVDPTARLAGIACPLVSTLYYSPFTAGSITTGIPPEATERGFSFVAGRSCTLNRIGLEVTVAGTSGAVIRLGIRSDNAGVPGNVLLDAGTIDGTSNTLQTITISQDVTAGTVYWLTMAVQGGAGTRPTIRTSVATNHLTGDTNSATVSGNAVGAFSAGSVSGALGNSNTWSATTATPRILIRAA